jgi:hypothetical protein
MSGPEERRTGMEPRSHWRAWRTPDDAGAIYGIIAATAVIAVTGRHEPPGRVLAVTAATLLVFWLAHVYAEALARHLRGATRLRLATITETMVQERPMLEAPTLSLLLLLLGALGLLDDHAAVNLALWAGVVQLVGWGAAYARRQGWGWPTAVVTGLVNGTFGVAVIALEVFIH